MQINSDDCDRSPLLPINEHDGDADHHGDGGTAFTAFFTMCTACAGAGILSLPLAVSQIGVVACCVTLVIFGAANTFTLRVLADLTDVHRDELNRNQFSYEQLVTCVLGRSWGRVFSVIILCTQFGALVAYWVILLDLGVPVVQQHDWIVGLSDVDLRAAVAFSLAICVIFPLSFYKKIHNLWIVVVLAMMSVVWTSGIVVSEGITKYNNPTDHTVDPKDPRGELDHVSFNTQNWIQTLPAIVFTFNCHQQLTPVYGLTLPAARQKVRLEILPFALLFCTCIYIITAVAGYVRFADKTKGDILLNFVDRSWQGDSSKLLMALHVVLAYPVVLFPALRALDTEFPQSCGGAGKTGGSKLFVEGSRNLTFVLLTATLAVFLPNVQVVFGFVGGVLCSCSVFIFPCAMKLATAPRDKTTGRSVQRVISVLLLLFGFFLVGSSLYVSISGIVQNCEKLHMEHGRKHRSC